MFVQDVDHDTVSYLRSPKKSVWKASLELQLHDRVYIPPLSNYLPELRQIIEEAIDIVHVTSAASIQKKTPIGTKNNLIPEES